MGPSREEGAYAENALVAPMHGPRHTMIAMIAMIMRNSPAFRTPHDPEIMIAWIKGVLV
jgi:hypothetical protein